MRSRVFRQELILALVTDLRVDDIGLVLDELGLGQVQVGLVLIHDHLIGLGIDLCAQLPLMDPGVVVAVEGLDRARDISPHLDDHHRIDRSTGGDGGDDIALGHGGRHITRRRGAVCQPVDDPPADQDRPSS